MLTCMVSLGTFKKIRSEVLIDIFQNENIFLIYLEANSLKNITFPINSQLYSFHKVNGIIELNEHYNIGNQKQTINIVGSWQNGNISLTRASLLERRKNLNGLQLKAETLPSPWMFKITAGKLAGIIGDLWHEIVEVPLN